MKPCDGPQVCHNEHSPTPAGSRKQHKGGTRARAACLPACLPCTKNAPRRPRESPRSGQFQAPPRRASPPPPRCPPKPACFRAQDRSGAQACGFLKRRVEGQFSVQSWFGVGLQELGGSGDHKSGYVQCRQLVGSCGYDVGPSTVNRGMPQRTRTPSFENTRHANTETTDAYLHKQPIFLSRQDPRASPPEPSARAGTPGRRQVLPP